MDIEWPIVPLGSLTSKIGSGATPRGGKDSYVAHGISLVRSQNVYNGGFTSDGLAFITDDQAALLSNVDVESQDVLVNITGDSVARSCMVPESVLPARVNQHVAIVRADREMLDPLYLRFVLISPTIQNMLKQLASAGATRNALTKSMLEQITILLPPLDEQRRIAHILGTLDDKIELNSQMNQTLDEIARTLFRSWFVDFGPVRAKMDGRQPEGMDAATAALFPDRLVDSELGPIPEGWKWGTFDDVAESVRENVNSQELTSDDAYLGLEHFAKRELALYSWGGAGDLASNKFRFRANDILFGKLRPYFHKVSIAPVCGVCSTEILVIRPKRSHDMAWVATISASDSMIERATMQSTGTRMPRANWGDVGGFPIAIPGESVRNEFERHVGPLLELINSNVLESRALAELLDTLLPKLLSGGSISGGT